MNKISPRRDGYTYWKLEKTKLKIAENGPQKTLMQGLGRRTYNETTKIIIRETVNVNL